MGRGCWRARGFRWGGRGGSHGRRADRVSHGAHQTLRGLWRGMGTVAPRRERAGGVLLLNETHPLEPLLVQGPGNGPPYFMESPPVLSGPKSPEEGRPVGDLAAHLRTFDQWVLLHGQT